MNTQNIARCLNYSLAFYFSSSSSHCSNRGGIQSGGKDNPLLDRLRVLLLISLLFLAFLCARHRSRSSNFWPNSLLLYAVKFFDHAAGNCIGADHERGHPQPGAENDPSSAASFDPCRVCQLSLTGSADQAERDAAARCPHSLLRRNCCGDRPAGQGNHFASHPQPRGNSTDRCRQSPALCCCACTEKQLAPLLIVTAGPRPELEGSVGEAKDIETLLANNMGVPRSSIVLDDNGRNIRTSAQEVRKILDGRGVGRKVILVTSAIQMRRASLAFANMGIQVIPRATDFYTYQPTAGGKSRLRLDAGKFFA